VTEGVATPAVTTIAWLRMALDRSVVNTLPVLRSLQSGLAYSALGWRNDMGLFSSLFRSSGSGKTKTTPVYGKNANRTYAPRQKQKDPNSNRSTDNTSRYKRF
jgi:hypothetical protein